MNTMSTHSSLNALRRGRRAALVALAALAALGSADTASARERYAVLFDGPGTSELVDGTAHLTGQATGQPFDGSYVAALAAADGTLPAPGECEPATVALALDGLRRNELALSATGDVCGQWTGPGNVVTHAFTGRYLIESGRPRRLVGTDGFIEVRLTVDGRGYVFAIST